MGKVFDLNGKDLTKTDATLRVPEAPADAAAVGKQSDVQTESLKAEKSRAEGAEQKLQQQVDTLNAGGLNLKEDIIRTQVDSYLTQHPEAMGTALAEETERAKGVENGLRKDVNEIGLIKSVHKLSNDTGVGTNNTNVYWLNFNAPVNALASSYVYLTLDFSSKAIGKKVLIYGGTVSGREVTLTQIETFTISSKTETFKLAGGLDNMIFGFHGEVLYEQTGEPANASDRVVDYANYVSWNKVGDKVSVKTLSDFNLSYSYEIRIDLNTDAIGLSLSKLQPENIIRVSQDGTKEYTSIAQAVIFAKTKASSKNPITIIIYPGIYHETITIQNAFVSLVGVNKRDCVIINDLGGYEDSPILASGNFYIANLTIKATHDGTPDFVENRTDDYKIGGYGLHIDNADYSDERDKIGVVENCIIYSAQNQAIGMGMAKNCKYIIRNCELINDTPDRMYELYTRPLKTGALGCHRGYFDGSNYYQILEVSNCILKVNKGVSIQLGPFTKEGTGMEEHFYNNMLWSGTLGKADSAIGTYSESPYTSFELSGDCYGNNVSALNK